MFNWLKRLFTGSGESQTDNRATGKASEKAPWIEAGAPENPFDVRIVDLMQNLEMMSFSQKEAEAKTAMSWRPGDQERLKVEISDTPISCDLRYPIKKFLPEGMLFIPQAMEDKWVIGWRNGYINFARSWTGQTAVTAEASIENGELRLSKLHAKGELLEAFGELPTVVDWIMRSHAMEERLALPVDEDVADLLHNIPMIGMQAFGHRLFCAGVGYSMPKASRPLYSDGDVAKAIFNDDANSLKNIASKDAWITPSRTAGCTPLVLAALIGHYKLCQTILDLGSDVHVKDAKGGNALQAGIVSGGGPEVARMFIEAGAKPDSANDDGFTSVHAAAEVDDPKVIRFLSEQGANMEALTNRGYRPIHITAGLGHMESAKALVECGVDTRAKAEGRTATQIARDEGHEKLAQWFEKV